MFNINNNNTSNYGDNYYIQWKPICHLWLEVLMSVALMLLFAGNLDLRKIIPDGGMSLYNVV